MLQCSKTHRTFWFWSTTMTINTEQLAAANKANLNTLVELTQKAFASIEKLVELNMQAARDSLEQSAEQAKAVLTVKGPQELAALQQDFLKPAQEKAMAYGRQVYDIATSTQAEVTKMAEAQIAAAKTQFSTLVEEATKNAPQGSEAAMAMVKSAMTNASTAFESVQKAAQQATNLAETNLKNLGETAEKATKAATKRRG
jgi:phasin family protein